jgi:hypothetical protein
MAGAKAVARVAPKAGGAGGKMTPAPARRGNGSLNWLLGVACGAILAFATPTALLGGVLLAPAILTAVFDTQAGRPLTRVVFVAAAGFTFGPIWHLNAAEPTLAAALDMLSEPSVLCPAWLAGGSGWAVCEFLPLLLRLVGERQAAARIAALEAEAQGLREAWDLTPRG